MEKEFIPYEQALDLKELGFNEPCLKYWNGIGKYFDQKDWFDWNQTEYFVSVPLYQQAFRWFREKYGLKHDIDDDNVGTKFYYKIRSYTDKFDNYYDIIKPIKEERDWSKIEFYSYEGAELACLIKLIEVAKNSK